MGLNIKDIKFEKIRKKCGEIEVYNPSATQRQELINQLKNKATVQNIEGKLSANLNVTETELARYLLSHFTNITGLNKISDKQLEARLANPRWDLQQALEEVAAIYGDITYSLLNRQEHLWL